MEPSRDDFIIAIRSAFLKKGTKQRFSLLGLLFFSILVFSNFIPSIYFGLLTSLAMLMALLSSLILLPQLLILFKPFDN